MDYQKIYYICGLFIELNINMRLQLTESTYLSHNAIKHNLNHLGIKKRTNNNTFFTFCMFAIYLVSQTIVSLVFLHIKILLLAVAFPEVSAEGFFLSKDGGCCMLYRF